MTTIIKTKKDIAQYIAKASIVIEAREAYDDGTSGSNSTSDEVEVELVSLIAGAEPRSATFVEEG